MSNSFHPHPNVGVVVAGADFLDGHIRVSVGHDEVPTVVHIGPDVSIIAGHECTDAQFAELFEKIATDLRRKLHERDAQAVVVVQGAIGATS